MKDKKITQFLNKLSGDFFLFAPQNFDSGLKIQEVKDLESIDWSGEMPINTWKNVFFPQFEKLFNIEKNKLVEIKTKYPPIACVGINILDLRALTLFELVFSSDSYFQRRRRNILTIGYSKNWPGEYKRMKTFSHDFEENILEHVMFDVFIAKLGNGKMKIYSGSEKGQLALENYGIKDYQHIEFAGPISEKGPDKKMMLLKRKMENSLNKKIWNELDKVCIACGKCSINCPTCFCFDIEDNNNPEKKTRSRKWGVCFYNDFSAMAGGHKPLSDVKKKIYFWYTHKFVRIPHEYGIPGCVSCGRCARTCPVGIKIKETFDKL